MTETGYRMPAGRRGDFYKSYAPPMPHGPLELERGDIKDAGNCLAMELHTAAVCHLMGATNSAVMALGRHLKIKIQNIEHHDWKPILAVIGAKLEKAHALKRGPKKQKELEFYGDILGELSALKDVHRNNVSHSRKRYNEQEALGVYKRVKSLMQRLATRLAEHEQ